MTEEHTKKTWLEEYIEDNATSEDRAMAYMTSKEICKKILEEVHKKWEQEKSYNGKTLFSDIGNELEKIIKDLGVKV
ncbi:MAG: hypothetical protein KBT21_08560 [Treponema sp.]|nr:hypothetical protein [Candidatus Treponema merdequi]